MELAFAEIANVKVVSSSSQALALPPGAGLVLVAECLAAHATADGVALPGKGGLLTDLSQRCCSPDQIG